MRVPHVMHSVDQAGAQHSQSPMTAECGADDQTCYSGKMVGNKAGNDVKV
jgi:hypothetical protein